MPRFGSQKGIGLIEVVIAILIFGLGIAAALRTVPDSNRATMRAEHLTMATNLAQEKIEDLMGSPFADAGLTAGTHADAGNPLERIYTRRWTVTDNVPMSDMKQVVVTVTFTGAGNDNGVSLTTYLTSRR
jgi:Tfp pilus assembly protein PilV